jgi:hypothetical protein
MNVDIKNREDFEKKKKITIICLSALVFITLIAGFFLAKKNKESSFGDNSVGEVVNENNKNDNEKENDNDNENDYFFNKASGQITINILLFLITGILFFFWENDKLPEGKKSDSPFCSDCNKKFLLCIGDEISGDDCCANNVYCGFLDKSKSINIGFGIFEKSNCFGFASLGFLIFITFLVELSLHFLIGSLSLIFSVKIRIKDTPIL